MPQWNPLLTESNDYKKKSRESGLQEVEHTSRESLQDDGGGGGVDKNLKRRTWTGEQ